MDDGVSSAAPSAAATMPTNDMITQRLICGYCKISYPSIEELKTHMKEMHLPKTGSSVTHSGNSVTVTGTQF